MKGFFIVLEGLDGAGKTTQGRLLVDWLQKQGYDVAFSREPGGCSISEQIRQIILDNHNAEMDDVTECYLYAAARCQHVRQVIAPALRAGKVVVCDRYLDSSLAYQGYARGLGEELVSAVNQIAVGKVLPDLTIYFDMPYTPERLEEHKDRLENSGAVFFQKVNEGYRRFYQRPGAFVVDATDSVGAIQQKIRQKVEASLHGSRD